MQKLDTRKEVLLSAVVREHSRTAQPVASDVLKHQVDVSSATIRNEMAVLEKEGYLRQPHTSAGRIPTEKGYRYYISNCLEEKKANRDFGLQGIDEGPEEKMKQIARELAEELSQGVFIGFNNGAYYTGLSQLFSQPEFESVELVRHLSEMIDNLDDVVADLFENVDSGIQVYIGTENPFGEECGTVLLKTEEHPMLGVVGPMRMDYDKVVSLMKEIQQIL